MDAMVDPDKVEEVASAIEADIQALPAKNTAAVRAVRRHYSGELKAAEPAFVFDLARELMKREDQRWLAYELIRYHPAAFQQIGRAELEEFGQGINSWGSVDTFARILSGPAWLSGQVQDEAIHEWARSEDFWWRRAALVSTVALNLRSQGGRGDTGRTVAVCEILAADHEDMIVKALSWALRALVVHDPEAVNEFLIDHEAELAARVKREVRNKLETGLKNPARS